MVVLSRARDARAIQTYIGGLIGQWSAGGLRGL